jgi:chromosome segregation ATPase
MKVRNCVEKHQKATDILESQVQILSDIPAYTFTCVPQSKHPRGEAYQRFFAATDDLIAHLDDLQRAEHKSFAERTAEIQRDRARRSGVELTKKWAQQSRFDQTAAEQNLATAMANYKLSLKAADDMVLGIRRDPEAEKAELTAEQAEEARKADELEFEATQERLKQKREEVRRQEHKDAEEKRNEKLRKAEELAEEARRAEELAERAGRAEELAEEAGRADELKAEAIEERAKQRSIVLQLQELEDARDEGNEKLRQASEELAQIRDALQEIRNAVLNPVASDATSAAWKRTLNKPYTGEPITVFKKFTLDAAVATEPEAVPAIAPTTGVIGDDTPTVGWGTGLPYRRPASEKNRRISNPRFLAGGGGRKIRRFQTTGPREK